MKGTAVQVQNVYDLFGLAEPNFRRRDLRDRPAGGHHDQRVHHWVS
jgi:hypothetical protein